MTQERNEKRIAQLQADKDKLRLQLDRAYDTVGTNTKMMQNLLEEIKRLQDLARRYGAPEHEIVNKEPVGK